MGTPNIPTNTSKNLVNQYFEGITHNPKVIILNHILATIEESPFNIQLCLQGDSQYDKINNDFSQKIKKKGKGHGTQKYF